MQPKTFWLSLSSLTLMTFLLLGGLLYLPLLQPYFGITCVFLCFFLLLTILVYFTGRRAAHSSNPNMFTNVVMIFMFVKMFASLFLLLIYSKTQHPQTRFFLIPFFLIYLIYTIFETWVMMRLGKNSKK